jgi:hypothetical protein
VAVYRRVVEAGLKAVVAPCGPDGEIDPRE